MSSILEIKWKIAFCFFPGALCASPITVSKLKPVFLPDHGTLNGDVHKFCIYLQYIVDWPLINNVFPSFIHPYSKLNCYFHLQRIPFLTTIFCCSTFLFFYSTIHRNIPIRGSPSFLFTILAGLYSNFIFILQPTFIAFFFPI